MTSRTGHLRRARAVRQGAREPAHSRRAAVLALAACALVAAGCGDNLLIVDAPPLERATALFVIAHFDDDMIFMQPELLRAIERDAVTTIYVTSGDEVHGIERADRTFNAARTAYGAAAGSQRWRCGYLWLDGWPIEHCRLADRPVSLVALGLPDGGLDGALPDGLLHLVEGSARALPILNRAGGGATATLDAAIATLAQLIAVSAPATMHTLDRAATHGRDHSSHLMSASLAFWAAARAGYRGPVIAHRGYNVEDSPPTLSDADCAAVTPMLAHFDACYFGCAECGKPCTALDLSHGTWMQRQYATRALPADQLGKLTAPGAPGRCLAVVAGAITLADCATATVELDGTGHLVAGEACVASAPGNDDPLVLAPCRDDPAQRWLLDQEGYVWNGQPPVGAPGMAYDHVRCLALDPGRGTAGAPICGAHRHPTWQGQATGNGIP